MQALRRGFRWRGHADVEQAVAAAAEVGGQHPRVRHAEWGDGIVMREEDDRLTVLFDEQGYRTLSLRAVRDNNLLTLRPTA